MSGKVPVQSLMCSSIKRHHIVNYILVPLLDDWSETSQLYIIGMKDCSSLWGAHQSLHLLEGSGCYYHFSFFLFKQCIMYSMCFYTSCSLVFQCFAKRFQIPVDWWFPRLCSRTLRMLQCLKAFISVPAVLFTSVWAVRCNCSRQIINRLKLAVAVHTHTHKAQTSSFPVLLLKPWRIH